MELRGKAAEWMLDYLVNIKPDPEKVRKRREKDREIVSWIGLRKEAVPIMGERELLLSASFSLQSIRDQCGLPDLAAWPRNLKEVVDELLEIDCALPATRFRARVRKATEELKVTVGRRVDSGLQVIAKFRSIGDAVKFIEDNQGTYEVTLEAGVYACPEGISRITTTTTIKGIDEEMADLEAVLLCCYIDDKGNACDNDAELMIVYGYAPDDYTYSCPWHAERLLVDAPFNYVYPLDDFCC